MKIPQAACRRRDLRSRCQLEKAQQERKSEISCRPFGARHGNGPSYLGLTPQALSGRPVGALQRGTCFIGKPQTACSRRPENTCPSMNTAELRLDSAPAGAPRYSLGRKPQDWAPQISGALKGLEGRGDRTRMGLQSRSKY